MVKKSHTKKNKKAARPEDEQVQDVLAWGKSRQNYYKQSQEQYSEASEEQDQARRIYQNQYENLNEDNFYQLPQQQDQNQPEDQASQQQQGINEQYIKNEILWASELAKMFEGVQDDKSELRKKVYDSYLLILMCLKQFKIPHVDQHPLLEALPDLKRALKVFEGQIQSLYEEHFEGGKEGDTEENEEVSEGSGSQGMDMLDEEEDGSEGAEQFEQPSVKKQHSTNRSRQSKNRENNSGMAMYEKMKQEKQQERKSRKQESKNKRAIQLPKQAFRTVTQNEGRLANEKIMKNKGLMKRRRRGDGNSRVNLRYKYEKALVRRKAKGFVGVKENPGRFYEGEDKVLYGKIASTKIH